ncbi:MAG: hypothetical protein WC733_08885 [Methylophilus sp.]|jgi:hypothetical protein
MHSLEANTLHMDDKYQLAINHFHPSESGNLFNEIAYFKLHTESEHDSYMQLVSVNNQQVHATLAFYQVGEQAFASPKRGTFGGLTVHSSLEFKVVESFVTLALSYLKKLGAHEITIKLAPFSHDLALSSMMTNILLRQGFAIANHELNYDLIVDEQSLSDRASYGNRKRIRKCLRDGIIAEQVALDRYLDVYAVIKENRLRKGFGVSMSAEQLAQMVDTFPDRVVLFSAWENAKKSKMIASAVCLALSPSILYVFYWGDIADVEAYSPITLLAATIYDYCQKNAFQILDVGTSTVAGEPNYGLINFKQHLDFTESLKPTFVWSK